MRRILAAIPPLVLVLAPLLLAIGTARLKVQARQQNHRRQIQAELAWEARALRGAVGRIEAINALVGRFVDEVLDEGGGDEKRLAAAFSSERRRSWLSRLPGHEAYLVASGQAPRVVASVGMALGLRPAVEALVTAHVLDITGGRAGDTLKQARQRLQGTGFVVPREALGEASRRRAWVSRGSGWQRLLMLWPVGQGLEWVFVIGIDLAGVPANLEVVGAVARWRHPRFGLQWLPRGDPRLWRPSAWVRHRPGLSQRLRQEGLRVRGDDREGAILGDVAVVGVRFAGAAPGLMLVMADLDPAASRMTGAEELWLVGLAIVAAVGAVVVVERRVFERGTDLSVRFSLVTACMGLVWLPASAADLLVPLWTGHLVGERLAGVGRAVQHDLDQADGWLLRQQIGLSDRIEALSRWTTLGRLGVTGGESQEIRRRAFMRAAELARRDRLHHLAVLVDDPAGKPFSVESRYSGRMGVSVAGGDILTRLVQHAFGVRSPAFRRPGSMGEETQREMLVEVGYRAFGPLLLQELLHGHERVKTMRLADQITRMKMRMVIDLAGLPRLGLVWHWHVASCDWHMLHELVLGKGAVPLERGGTRSFVAPAERAVATAGVPSPMEEASPRPTARARSGLRKIRLLALQARRNQLRTIPEPIEELMRDPTGLGDLLVTAHQLGAPLQRWRFDRPERLCQYARPSRTAYATLATERSATDVLDGVDRVERRAAMLFWAVLAGAGGLGFLAAIGLLMPLRRMMVAVAAVDRGDYTVRLRESRLDELGMLARAFDEVVQGLAAGRILQRFVSSEVRRRVGEVASSDELRQALRQEVTVVYAALHGFSRLQRSRPLAEVFRMLERHLRRCTRLAHRFGGEVDKMIGDKVMVVFSGDRIVEGADETSSLPPALGGTDGGGDRCAENSADRALRFAAALVDERDDVELVPVIGVNTGVVIAGAIGSPDVRLDQTVIGDPVNLAARLAALAYPLHGSRIVVSGETRARARRNWAMTALPISSVRGKTQQVTAFELELAGESFSG